MRIEPVNFLANGTQRASSKKYRRVFFVFIVFGILYLSGCVSEKFFFKNLPQEAAAYDPVTLEPLERKGFFGKMRKLVFSQEPHLAGKKKDRINILLLGQGGPGHDGPYLTDTIIIASIKPSTKEVAMISIPRDLAVDIPKHGIRKINHANAFGESANYKQGPELAKKVIEKTFDIPINYYIRVDFRAFKEIINEIDGITVDVERTFTDQEYPAPNDEFQTVHFSQGVQQMDGTKALTFVRSRHGNNNEGSDFARSKRQQRVLLAIKEKALSFQTLANPLKIQSIIQTLGSNIVTNLAFSDIITMTKLAKNFDIDHITTLNIASGPEGFLDHGKNERGEYVLIPKEENFDRINEAIEMIFEKKEYKEENTSPRPKEPTLRYDNVNIEIHNGTWRAGLAARTKKTLLENTFHVSLIQNSKERPTEESYFYIAGDVSPNTIEALKKTLPIKQSFTAPTSSFSTSTTDILIILGEDFLE